MRASTHLAFGTFCFVPACGFDRLKTKRRLAAERFMKLHAIFFEELLILSS
jgi:hypothetical protein